MSSIKNEQQGVLSPLNWFLLASLSQGKLPLVGWEGPSRFKFTWYTYTGWYLSNIYIIYILNKLTSENVIIMTVSTRFQLACCDS